MATFQTFPRHRLDALVDAILAISMTLLVLELQPPSTIHGNFWPVMIGLEPKFISWIVSFLILALCWLGHITNFHHVEHVDKKLFWLTVYWLLVTTMVPFSSLLIGEYNQVPGAHITYAANLIAIQLVVVLRNHHLRTHPGLFAERRAVDEYDTGYGPAIIICICALLSAAAAQVTPEHASLVYFLILPAGAIYRRILSGRNSAASR